MKKRILIVSHDAGGAEVLSSWVRKNDQYQYRFLIDGPAINIFFKKLGCIERYTDADMGLLIQSSDMVLTSTSWSSNLEKKAVRLAKENEVQVVSYLDHWICYQERFSLLDEIVLPDQIWVGDELAESIAKVEFPNSNIVFVKNEFFVDIDNQFKKIKRSNANKKIHVLFISQPIKAASAYLESFGKKVNFDEFDVFRLLVQSLKKAIEKYDVSNLTIRLHPSEVKNKYFDCFELPDLIEIKISNNADLVDDIAQADWVVGSYSMAMVHALRAKKEVFSLTPCESFYGLPHEGIRSFEKFVGLESNDRH